MAKHKKTEANEIVKTFSFKVKNPNSISLDVFPEYQRYYNCVSDWIKDNILLKIGDLYQYIPLKKRESEYAKAIISDEWKDKPLFMMFTKGYSSNNRDNAIYEAINACNPENYTGNILGISDTYYRRLGYIGSVVSNYAAKISKMNTGVKKHTLPENPDDVILMEQTIYEMSHNGWTSLKDWDGHMEYLDSKMDSNIIYKQRIAALYDFYKSHINEVNSKMETMTIDNLVKFGGCRRKDSKKSIYIGGPSGFPLTIKQIDGNSFNIKFVNNINIDVYGRRDVIKDGVLLYDIINKHGNSFIIKIKNDEMYIDTTITVPFNKKIATTKKVVGVDVNVKHMLLATSINDENLNGYVNIYKEVISDPDFKKVCNGDLMRHFTNFSEFTTFCPLEFDLLFSRICKQKDVFDENSVIEEAFSNVLDRLKWRFFNSGDNVNRIYIENVMKLRSQLKSYAILKNAYYKKQSEYDLGKSEEFIQEHPFADTDTGKEMILKMKRVGDRIIGCRNNIIQYAYGVFKTNGYDMISLENLSRNGFEKTKTFPTVTSIMKKHKILGCTKKEMEANDVYSVIQKGYYDIIFDNGKVSDVKLSQKGELQKIKDDFFDLLMKVIHFADIKDYFITLSNNGTVGVSLVPSEFTSQMDSIEHKIYCSNDKNGNLKLVNKHRVRTSQERHINGLNADYNAANNIAYIVSDDKFRNWFTRQSRTDKPLYNKPSYESTVKSPSIVVSKLKKEGMVKVMEA